MRLTRRQMLSSAAAGLGLPMILPSSAFGAEEKIRMAFIGLGNRGIGVMEAFLNHADVQGVAVCDVHDHHYRELEWGKGRALGREPGKAVVDKKYGNTDCRTYSDYRELFDREKLDAVLIATPDHWHATITLAALAAGLDVYCEKPVTHLFAEGQAVYREVAKRGAVFQVGSQQRSEPVFRQAVELVRNGVIGKIQRVEVGLPAGYETAQGSEEIVEPPAGLDYDTWCGPAPKLPYMRARHHRWWRGNSAYGGGTLMDWIGHHNDIAHWGLGCESSGPVHVEARGWTWSKAKSYDTPVNFEIVSEYAGGVEGIISTNLRNGAKWIGEDGWVWVDRGKIEASNPEWLAEGFVPGAWKGYASPGHQRNFIDCVKSRAATAAPAENGHRSITPGHLGLISARLGRGLKWDPMKEQVVGDEEAQTALMKIEYRSDFTV